MIDNKKITNAWAFYDWGNSVYALVITAAIFPIYWGSITQPIGKEKILIYGLEPSAIFDFSLCFSFLIVLIISPILSSIADSLGNKLNFLKLFTYLGGFSCMGLFFFSDKNTIWVGLLFNILASIGYWGSLVFYNSYLSDISSKEKQDSLSAKGYIFGYVGSVILLIFCLFLIMVIADEPKQNLYTRICFLLTGIWWMGFAQYTFLNLPVKKIENRIKKSWLKDSFKSIFKIGVELSQNSVMKKYLISFFFSSLGMQTIFLMATLFGQTELKLNTTKLILTILIIQFIAIFGAWFFSNLSKKIGNFLTLSIGIFIWIFICLLGYTIDGKNTYAEIEFYFIASLVGLVMGGIQSLSRSTYSKLLPKTNNSTLYFSFYDMLEKFALVIGLLIYGILIQQTGGMKTSTFAMGISFVFSLLILTNLYIKHNKI